MLSRNKFHYAIISASFMPLLIAYILYFAYIFPIGTKIVMHFDSSGADVIGTRTSVLQVLLIALFLFIINSLLALFLKDRLRPMFYALGFFNLLLSVLILIFIGVIITVN